MAYINLNTSGSSENPKKDVPVLSDYASKLEPHVKRRYLEKIAVIGVDPAMIPDKNFNPECLPPIEATDMLCYLVLETSFYTREQFKAFKSLEAYNQMVSGFITSVQGHIVAGKYLVLAKVRHSQRMNDPPLSIWIITDKEGTILSAHCLGCMAGLSETCSHVASVLFYIEAWTRIHGKLACTQVKCSWILPTYVKEVPYARVRDINFSSARKMKADMDKKIENLEVSVHAETSPSPVPAPSPPASALPTPTVSEMASFYAELNQCSIKPVALSLIKPYAESFVKKSRIISTISELFYKKYLDYSYPDLLHACSEVRVQLSEADIRLVERDTQEQAKGSGFFKHRAGRIGASQSKAACHTDPTQPSQSLISSICYPNLFKVTTKAILHGCKHEGDAIQAYEAVLKPQHASFEVKKCGTFINKEHQFLHATPDFLCFCACCGEGCGEVKCPVCIDDCNFDSYVEKKASCLEKVEGTYKLKRNHQYYYQVQQQLFTTHKKYCDFVVCAFDANHRAFVHERIYPDSAFWDSNLPKLTTFWRTCVLPEILGRWYTNRANLPMVAGMSDDICYCRMDKGAEPTVTCSNLSCPFSKFHLSCLRITTPTPKTWYYRASAELDIGGTVEFLARPSD